MVAPPATCRLDPRHMRVPPRRSPVYRHRQASSWVSAERAPRARRKARFGLPACKIPPAKLAQVRHSGHLPLDQQDHPPDHADCRRDAGGRRCWIVCEPSRGLDRWPACEQPRRDRTGCERLNRVGCPGRRPGRRAEPRCHRHDRAIRAAGCTGRAGRAGSAAGDCTVASRRCGAGTHARRGQCPAGGRSRRARHVPGASSIRCSRTRGARRPVGVS